MKRFLCITIALILALSLIGCGNKAATEEPEIKYAQPGKLVVATNATFPPYETVDNDGYTIVGIDIDIAQMIADELGLELEVMDMEFASVLAAVETGKCDIGLAGLTVTEERLKNVNFSDPYAKGIQSIIVKKDGDIKSVDDLSGHMIGVQESTTGHIYCEDDFGTDNVIAYSAGAMAVQALLSDIVDCVVIDNNPAKEFVKSRDELTILDTAYSEEEYAIAIEKTNEAMLTKVNEILKKKTEDGTVQKIIDKWIVAE